VDTLAAKPYIRLAHGWGTESNLSEILSGNTEKDPYNNQLTSVFFGVPLADELFDMPIATYLTPGIAHHLASDVQDRSTEWVLAVKFYYTINWPTPWRLGVCGRLVVCRSDSLSGRKGHAGERIPTQPAAQFSGLFGRHEPGASFPCRWMEDLWLGYSIHHRSGIFSTSSAFGRISGGSNYNTVYLQYHW
jgi:outer membrane protein